MKRSVISQKLYIWSRYFFSDAPCRTHWNVHKL